MPTWDPEHAAAASLEGWDIFECFGSENADWQIQRDDEMAVFADDTDAWFHVWGRAMEGSELHLRALQVIAAWEPREMAYILQSVNYDA